MLGARNILSEYVSLTLTVGVMSQSAAKADVWMSRLENRLHDAIVILYLFLTIPVPIPITIIEHRYALAFV